MRDERSNTLHLLKCSKNGDSLFSALNMKLVQLTSISIINHPNKIEVLFNLLHEYIKTLEFPICVEGSEKVNSAGTSTS